MISDPIVFIIESLLIVWLKGGHRVQAILVFAVVLGFASLLVYAAGSSLHFSKRASRKYLPQHLEA
jgi:uncharacterized membrane protein